MSERILVLMLHGSSDPRWRQPFEELAHSFQRLSQGSSVQVAYLQHTGPTLAQVVARGVQARVSRFQVLPLFLSAGGHVSRDLPRLCDEIRREFPAIDVELLPPMGEHPAFQRMLREIIAGYLDPP
ncbi:MAG: CbiX/SirB N-terminal domain-containing protein [Acidobacteria bacterium]|nr:CbiX/SirB N-terminal domain-containing protein [Acidobacteriota bacterium]